ncbi:MAG: hypothetical protein M0P97_02905 [Candidatus Moranbacteria bacterium]|jgi:hypothetical protein|nr:hypothetical protein [Candidatus Moranbacteria bacterium]
MEENIAKILGVAAVIILGSGLILGEETLREKFLRTKSIAIRWAVYSILDYGLTGLSILLVIIFKQAGSGFAEAFFAMWVFDFISAALLLVICIKSGKDLTLGQEYRRSIGKIFSRSKMFGAFSFFTFSMKASIWDGPERMVEYFKNELDTIFKKGIVVFFMTSLQALFWTGAYSLGYDGIMRFLNNI